MKLDERGMGYMNTSLVFLASYWFLFSWTLYGQEGPLKKVDRIVIEGKGFSIVPPPNWSIDLEQPGLTLFMQANAKDAHAFQRSIQVRFGRDPVVIDKFGANQYGEVLEKNRSAAVGFHAGYKLQSSTLIHLADGSPGVLYYSEFVHNDYPMMEMHLLISSEDGHFLLTYTDLSKYFDSNAPGSPLDVAYRSLISAQLTSQVGGRFDLLIRLGIIVGGLLLFWVVLRFILSRKTMQFDDSSDDDDRELPGSSLPQRPLSETEKMESDIHQLRSKTSAEEDELRAIEKEEDYNSDNPETWYDDDDRLDRDKVN